MKNIYDLTREELEKYLISINEKKFRAIQIYDWLYVKRVKSFANMTNLSNYSNFLFYFFIFNKCKCAFL